MIYESLSLAIRLRMIWRAEYLALFGAGHGLKSVLIGIFDAFWHESQFAAICSMSLLMPGQ
uniref:ABC transporter permease n=1 Tax=Meloidogyne incognita TaxID=6306 RepID=A0A914LCP2_MELIC